MKCSKAQKLLSGLHNGELSARDEGAVQEHIAGCTACGEMSTAYSEMMEMLAGAGSPELPAEFEGSLHARLAAANTRASQASAKAGSAPARLLRGGALVLVGAAAVAAFFIGRGAPEKERAGICPNPAADTAGSAIAPADLRVGEVAVLTLTFDGVVEAGDAEVELVLPDGLALVGEGRQVLEEKVVTWTTTLDEAQRDIRIPVQAKRPGTWRLVARARVGGRDVTSETELRVARA